MTKQEAAQMIGVSLRTIDRLIALKEVSPIAAKIIIAFAFSPKKRKEAPEVIEGKWSLHVPELDLAINTDLRKGSKYSLTWDMVDFRGRMLNIPRTKNEEPVYVPLNDAAVAALRVVQARGEWEGACVPVGKKPKSHLRMGGIGSTTR